MVLELQREHQDFAIISLGEFNLQLHAKAHQRLPQKGLQSSKAKLTYLMKQERYQENLGFLSKMKDIGWFYRGNRETGLFGIEGYREIVEH